MSMHCITSYVSFMEDKLEFLSCDTYSAHDVTKLIFIIIKKNTSEQYPVSSYLHGFCAYRF